MKKAVQFGAGNIGRGFIGNLLSESGYALTFVDIVEPVLKELNERRSYSVEVVGEKKAVREVAPVSGVHSDSPEAVAAVAEADAVTTAVGPNILKFIAPVIACGIDGRYRNNNQRPLNIIACENMIGGSATLRAEVEKHLDEPVLQWLPEHVGFPDSAVDRIVPPVEPDGDPLRVRVEEFSEWIVAKPGFVGAIPEIAGMQTEENLIPFLERKLFTLNTGHSITAYLGVLKGHPTIRESVLDEEILKIVRGAMEESGEVLIRRYGFDRNKHAAYIEKILNRFRNPWIVDDVNRVGRQPLRKLGYDDRLIKPLRGAMEYGTGGDNLILGIAAAFNYRNSDDEQAVELKKLVDEHGLESAILRVTGIDDNGIIGRILDACSDLPKL